MGFLSGSASFTRFIVEGSFRQDSLERYREQIIRNSFRDFDEHSIEERSAGWVHMTDIFDSEFEADSFLKPPYVALSFRVDVRKVPIKAIRQQCIRAEKEIMRNEELEFLPAARRKEIKEFLWNQLIRRAIPRTSTYDMIWNTENSNLFFGSTVNRIIDEFSEFFFRTFGTTLYSIFPYSLGWHMLQKDGDPSVMDSLERSRSPEGATS